MAFIQSSSPSFYISGLSRQDALNKIAREISRLEGDLSSLRSLHNSLAPISKLPTKLLSRIFMQCSGFDESEQFIGAEDLQMRLMVSWVSRHWRKVALEHKPLWHVINDDYVDPGVDYASACIARSIDHPLHIDLICPDEELMKVVLSSLSQVGVFTLAFRSDTSPPYISRILKLWRSPPLLHSLSLSWVPDIDQMTPSSFISRYRDAFGKLQTLTLQSCTFNQKSLLTLAPNVTKLVLSEPIRKISITGFLQTLASLSSLTNCTTTDTLEVLESPEKDPEGYHAPRSKILLPQLQDLNLTEPINCITQLLLSLDVPQASVAITRSSKEDSNISSHIFAMKAWHALRASQSHLWNNIKQMVQGTSSFMVYTSSESTTYMSSSICIPDVVDFDFALFSSLHFKLDKLESVEPMSAAHMVWEPLSVLKSLNSVFIGSTFALSAFLDCHHTNGTHDSASSSSESLPFPALQKLVLCGPCEDPELLNKLYELLAARSIRGMGLAKVKFTTEATPVMSDVLRFKKVVREVELEHEGVEVVW